MKKLLFIIVAIILLLSIGCSERSSNIKYVYSYKINVVYLNNTERVFSDIGESTMGDLHFHMVNTGSSLFNNSKYTLVLGEPRIFRFFYKGYIIADNISAYKVISFKKSIKEE